MTEIRVKGIEDLSRAAKEFLAAIRDKRVFAFNAPMGAGKTTFISALCHQLGVKDDDIASPTFALVNEYLSDASGESIYHLDCYRIRDDAEALDMGIEDYLYSGNLCFIEWPENIERFLPDDTQFVEIKEESDGTRLIKIL